MKTKKKALLTVLCAAALVFGSVFGTYAYLTDQGTVTNTFTVGNVDIDLYEHNYVVASNSLGTTEVNAVENYKFVPGKDLPKDPTVRVNAPSEACYLFVKVDEVNWPTNDKIGYAIDTNNWTQLQDKDGKNVKGVYYHEQSELASGVTAATYPVLKGDKITVSNTLTNAELKAMVPTQTNEQIKLVFTAYAIQQEGFSTPAAAWEEVSK